MATADAELVAALPAPPAGRLLVGYSGGLDSHVLLHLAWCRYGAAALTAVHVHHGLSRNADHWAQHCAETCAGLGIVLHAEHVAVNAGGGSSESNARAARYGVFGRLLGAGDVLLLAHHADDQAETVLYRLLRGGMAAGMPATRALGRGRLVRPLLAFSRERLRIYAERQLLQWIDDESNALLRADRNYLRHRVLPGLNERWPDAITRLGRAAALTANAADLHRELAELDLSGLDERAERVGRSLDLSRLLALPAQRRDNVLRHWLPDPELPEPGARVLAALVRDLVGAADDASPRVSWSGGQWRRFRGRLHLLPRGWGGQLQPDRGPWPWLPPVPLPLPDGAVLGARAVTGCGLRSGTGLTVRYRDGGERAQPSDRGASTSLKRILQERGLEPWLRDRVPLIERAGRLVAVGDLFVCAGAVAGPDEPGWLPEWNCPLR